MNGVGGVRGTGIRTAVVAFGVLILKPPPIPADANCTLLSTIPLASKAPMNRVLENNFIVFIVNSLLSFEP